jgi:hypothetical protein
MTPAVDPARRTALLIGLLAMVGTAGAAAPAPATVTLGAGGDWRFSSEPPASTQAFERAWGQFEVRLPRSGFPLPAPGCRDEIRLRWIALPPDTRQRDDRLAARWAVLQQLKALKVQAASLATDPAPTPVRIELDLRYYTRTDKDGAVSLTWCNAFVADAPR